MNVIIRSLGIFAFLGMVACSPKEEGFTVNIDLKNAEDGPIYVSQRIPNPTTWYTDTLQLKDGKAVFRGKLDYPRLVNFVFYKAGDFYGSTSMFLDNSRVQITGDFDNLKDISIRGSKAHDEYAAIESNGEPIFRKYSRLTYQRSKAFKDNRAAYDSLAPLCEQAYQEVFDYITNLAGYATSQVTPFFVSEYFNTTDMEKLEKALEKFDASLAGNAYVANCRKALEEEKKVLPGQTAYDFTLSDIQGKEYKLSDFRGKYVLLEFSASWCGWCKLEIPFLKTVHEVTQGKNFVMFTVNLDEDREKWEKDVKEYDLPWPVISDLKAFKSPVALNYNVSGIPMIYLIAPDGKIKEKGLRREAMIEYIQALWKE